MITILVALILLASAPVSACIEWFPLAVGANEVGVAQESVRVGLHVQPFGPGEKHRTGYFGLEVRRPVTILARLSVAIDGSTVYVPLSAVGDLADPVAACVVRSGDVAALRVRGGSASSSYESVLKFVDAKLVSRRTFLREFASERWEETTYSFVDHDDPER